jgi:hypothetical protein
MEEALTQVGVGGVLAILIIREVFNYTNKRKNGQSNGAFNKALCDERHKTLDKQHEETQSNFKRVFTKLDNIMEHLPGK